MRQRREASKTRGRRRRVLARARASSDAGHLAFSGGVAAHTWDFARSPARPSRSGTRDDGRVSSQPCIIPGHIHAACVIGLACVVMTSRGFALQAYRVPGRLGAFASARKLNAICNACERLLRTHALAATPRK